MRFLATLLLCLTLATPAKAEWHQASSTHFVVFADDSEKEVRRFAQNLEQFHSALSFVTAFQSPPPSPSSRVTIYVVRNAREVRKLYGDGGRALAGFYIPRAGGSLAIIPEVDSGGKELNFSMLTLLHEYHSNENQYQ